MIEKSKAIKNGVKILDNSAKNEFFENLKSNFPQTIKDGKADLKAISLLLGLNNKADVSGYELTWTGKGLSNAMYSFPCNKELRLDEIYSNNPKNIIIRGDNLDALKILKSAYTEKIKMIYIDPPYNTANDNFIYPDNFREDYKAILREVGLIEIDENGEETESENLRFFKNIQSSRTHSGWLSFMLPRLKLARDLLKEDGVIFISIDDNEQANLKILCDEIFGEDNFLAQIVWKQFHSVKNDANNFSKNTEYVLCYSKNLIKDIIHNEIFDKSDFYKLDDKDGKGFYKLDPVWAKSGTNAEIYIFKNGKSWRPPSGTFWRYSIETLKQMEIENEIVFNGKNPMAKRYLNKVSEGRKSSTFWDGKEVGYTLNGDAEVKNIFNNNKIFENPKPVNLIKRIIQISTSANSNDIILDFFAGSGTTAQAVMELNEEDGGNRQFILVQIDEEIKEEKSKVAYDFCKNELKSDKPAISDITIERVKRAANKIMKNRHCEQSEAIQKNKNVDCRNDKYQESSLRGSDEVATKQSVEKDFRADIGFKVFTLSDKPEIITNEEKSLELISQRTLNNMDIIINMALTNGKTLDKKIETIFDGKLYKCEDAFYLIECDKEILKFLSETQNEYILIDAYGDMELEDFLNLGAGFKERLRVVY